MKKLIIIAEGDTEEKFIKKSVRPYFAERGIYAVIPESFGGFRNGKYQKLQNDIRRHLLHSNDCIVSTLIDYYRLPTDFPGYKEAMQKKQIESKIKHIEEGMANDINNSRFIPYIQMHEFEALLFAGIEGFKNLPDITPNQVEQIRQIIKGHSTPEEINGGENTHPSKQLKEIIKGYNKVRYGEIIVSINGFDSILATCPRFNNWIETLLTKMKT